MIKAAMKTDIGLVRSNNEDCVCSPADGVFIVADGMGGPAAGEVASRIAAESALDVLKKEPVSIDALNDIFTSANERILEYAGEHTECNGMGTTMTVLAVLQDNRYLWAHVGDSRIYRLHAGELSQVTRDDSYVEELVEKGEITHEEARNHPRKNMLTRAVGVEKSLKAESSSSEYEAGDIFLLSSDGLTNMVTDDDIQDILSDDSTPDEKVDRLIKMALDAGGRDNISVIVVDTDA
ncbi:MAG: Stp1/IreP family PP2C-type Ser/Thr phosphatase [Veillonellaceae bacterium]|nr:Stp1/IreP family PP2C-type Ser/Thr phosphatase [Veillonellaceae bacterium]MDD6923751.1 Stp1/IreP family PP2C-type Ser/Thr phosphatase [Veillonellaceae bacterium]